MITSSCASAIIRASLILFKISVSSYVALNATLTIYTHYVHVESRNFKEIKVKLSITHYSDSNFVAFFEFHLEMKSILK